MAKGKKSKKQGEAPGRQLVATNRKARHRYEILDRYEAGIELYGAEVKSLRDGGVSISESYCKLHDNQIFVHNLNIERYQKASYVRPDPLRKRRLLLHRAEIRKIAAALERKGLALVPLSLYFKNGFAKLEIALARGKAAPDKRESKKDEQARRDLDREMARRR